LPCNLSESVAPTIIENLDADDMLALSF